MSTKRRSAWRQAASLIPVVLVVVLEPVLARELVPGQRHTVRQGDPPENWLVDGATLTVEPGAITLHIDTSSAAQVMIDAGHVQAPQATGLDLSGSTATINAATISASLASGLVVASSSVDAFGSTANVTASTVRGTGRGISISGPSTATLIDTRATGSGTGSGGIAGSGVGLTVLGATANVQGGVYTGSNRGVVMASISANTNRPLLNLDNVQVQSLAGSAILVGTANSALTHATINVANHSLLQGGNGVLLEVGQASTANRPTTVDFTVDNSALTGDVQVVPGSTATINLRNQASLSGNLSGISRLSLDSAHLQGNIVQEANTPALLTLSNGSTFSGTTQGAPDLQIDAGSVFSLSGDSSVGALDLKGGSVELGGAAPGFRVLTASSLTGSGTFGLGTDLATHQGDLLNVTGNASGEHRLLIHNTGREPASDEHAQPVVHTGGGDARFAVPGNRVDVGTWQYRLEQRGSDWYLLQAHEGEGGDGGTQEPIPTPGTRAVVGLFNAAPTVWYGELASLRSRMGELRNGRAQSGVWARNYGNKYRVEGSTALDYSQNQQGLALGVDIPLPGAPDNWRVGLVGGYSRSSLNMREGTSGTVDSVYMGVYSTWLSEHGWYVDGVLELNHLRNEASVRMSDGSKVEGRYNSLGLGASLEAGRHIDLEAGWFVEPFVQVSGLWSGSEGYRLDNGMQARSNGADSLLAKAGSLMGRTIALPQGGFIQPYLKLAVAHEFVSHNRVTVNDSQDFNNDLSGTRGELGAGVVLQWKRSLQLQADADYSRGEHIEQPWGLNVGLRYTW